MMVRSSKKTADFLRSYFSRQNWSLPDSIIYYILMNPSTSKVYEKLIQSCKYFFIKNPILVVPSLSFHYNGCVSICDKYFNIKNISSKFWVITNQINFLYEHKQNFIPLLISKIYKIKIHEIQISIQIFFNDFIFFASECEVINIFWYSIINANGSPVPLEKIIEVFPNLKYFYCHLSDNASNVITTKTVQNLLKIPHFSKLDRFTLENIPETFDVEKFFSHIKLQKLPRRGIFLREIFPKIPFKSFFINNFESFFVKNETTDIVIDFSEQISQEYSNRLQKIVDEIIATKNHEYSIPWILFPEIEGSSKKKLFKIAHQQFPFRYN